MNDEVRPPLTTTTSILPAAAVLGVAVLMLAAFLIVNFVANPRVTSTTSPVPIVVGGLPTQAGHLLAGCQQPGNPPADIAAALVVPQGTATTGPVQRANSGAGDYDCRQALATSATPGRLLGYYDALLPTRGWDLFSRGTSNGNAQLLFQKAGSDTFYWVVGVTIVRTGATTTYWTYRIYQNS
ncbi:MAG: hypothetical protein KGJ36_08990, partial [Acidobacteriota bacterium]|nr:hypothetical protein [Acidobacteriota bacterium]